MMTSALNELDRMFGTTGGKSSNLGGKNHSVLSEPLYEVEKRMLNNSIGSWYDECITSPVIGLSEDKLYIRACYFTRQLYLGRVVNTEETINKLFGEAYSKQLSSLLTLLVGHAYTVRRHGNSIRLNIPSLESIKKEVATAFSGKCPVPESDNCAEGDVNVFVPASEEDKWSSEERFALVRAFDYILNLITSQYNRECARVTDSYTEQEDHCKWLSLVLLADSLQIVYGDNSGWVRTLYDELCNLNNFVMEKLIYSPIREWEPNGELLVQCVLHNVFMSEGEYNKECIVYVNYLKSLVKDIGMQHIEYLGSTVNDYNRASWCRILMQQTINRINELLSEYINE